MRSAALLFAAGALALPKRDCLASSSASIAALSPCGDPAALAQCLTYLPAVDRASIAACFLDAGCDAATAQDGADAAFDRCADSAQDLRRRDVLADRTAPATTAAVPVLELFAARTLEPRSDKLECFSTSTVTTKTCPVTTNDGKPTTASCFSTAVAKSACAAGVYCTTDAKGGDICMKLDNDLGIGGIIIASVFAVAIAVGIGYLTFVCCKDRRDQKKLVARVEATALARAQTKRLRAAKAQEVKAPLMRQHSGQQPGGDPFADASRP